MTKPTLYAIPSRYEATASQRRREAFRPYGNDGAAQRFVVDRLELRPMASITGGSTARTVGSDYWLAIDADLDFAQGDILRATGPGPSTESTFGLIITADCDIAQSKAGNRLTYVEVVPTRVYLERVWIPDQLQKYLKKQSRVAAEGLTSLMRRSGLEMELTEVQLHSWLQARSVEEIGRTVNRTGRPLDSKLEITLNGLRCALGVDFDGERDALTQWCALRTLLGDSADRQTADLVAALAGGGGFADFFLLPEIPGANGVGYVALLRFIRTVDAGEVYRSEVDARIQGRSDALHRVGRLTDGIRFAITQKLAFLFSRIGLPTEYEDACKTAAALAAESLISGV